MGKWLHRGFFVVSSPIPLTVVLFILGICDVLSTHLVFLAYDPAIHVPIVETHPLGWTWYTVVLKLVSNLLLIYAVYRIRKMIGTERWAFYSNLVIIFVSMWLVYLSFLAIRNNLKVLAYLEYVKNLYSG